jgi:hypothetical protein
MFGYEFGNQHLTAKLLMACFQRRTNAVKNITAVAGDLRTH